MSLNPDTVLKTTRQVLEVEARLKAPLSASPDRHLEDESGGAVGHTRSVKV